MHPTLSTDSSAGAFAGPGRTYGGNRAFHNFYNDYSHISDPNLRRRLALSEIDKVPFGLYRASMLPRSPSRYRSQRTLY